MAGTIPLSMTQQFDEFGEPLSAGQLYIIQAGTVSTPQNPYQDLGLATVLQNPIVLDAAGRIPQFFLADGYIKVRLVDVHGVTQLTADNILVIGPSSGGGGGGATIDPTTIQHTGDIKVRYDTNILTGYVRANGKTIGSAVSGATELADPSAQALFIFLWGIDSTLVVTPPRGVSAAADWAANKQIALPDFRGCALSGLDDMGNTPAGRLTSTWFGVAATALGAFGGTENRALSNINQVPQHQHGVFLKDPGHAHTYTQASAAYTAAGGGTSVAVNLASANTGSATTGMTIGPASGAGAVGNVTANAGLASPASFAAIGPRKLITVYLKL
jgi:hypothetical protein